MKVTFTDATRARDCVQWAIKHVGPKTSAAGSVVRGEGWILWCNIPEAWAKGDPTYCVELNYHVDDETATMFMLKWA